MATAIFFGLLLVSASINPQAQINPRNWVPVVGFILLFDIVLLVILYLACILKP
jgi:hypothetical protein